MILPSEIQQSNDPKKLLEEYSFMFKKVHTTVTTHNTALHSRQQPACYKKKIL